MVRAILKPQTVSPDGKLRVLNGMANSALHPSSVRAVRTIQMPFQSSFVSPFANTRPSTMAPAGLVAKWKRVALVAEGVEHDGQPVIGVQARVPRHLRRQHLAGLRSRGT